MWTLRSYREQPERKGRQDLPGRRFPSVAWPVLRSGDLGTAPTFLCLRATGWIIVVEAVKRAFEKAKLKNVIFTPLDEVERMKL